MKNFTLITGASGGLGRAFSFECAKRGHNLLLTDINAEKLEDIVREVRQSYGVEVRSKTCDLSNEEERKQFFDFAKENNFNINFLINNAGYIAEGEFLSHANEEILKIIKVNCEGTIDMTQRVIKGRDKNQELKIITISSMSAYYPMPYMDIYSSTKAFLKNFMIALNEELKDQNVHITTVCPSGIKTTDAMKEAIKAQGKKGEMTAATPEYIANVALRASDRNKVVIIPKPINRFIGGISKVCSDKFLAKTTGKMWKKSLEKRRGKK